jgi:hypothetical protein
MPAAFPKGRFTIRTAAALFGLSAILELVAITAETPWFGAMRGGAPIILYHLAYVAVFLAVGAGLWTGARWGYWTVFAATALYTLDRIRYLLDRPGRQAEILYQLRDYRDVAELLGVPFLLGLSTLMIVTFVAGWWVFAAYIWVRREYFQQPSD